MCILLHFIIFQVSSKHAIFINIQIISNHTLKFYFQFTNYKKILKRNSLTHRFSSVCQRCSNGHNVLQKCGESQYRETATSPKFS